MDQVYKKLESINRQSFYQVNNNNTPTTNHSISNQSMNELLINENLDQLKQRLDNFRLEAGKIKSNAQIFNQK